MKSNINENHSKLIREGLLKAKGQGRTGGNPEIKKAQKKALRVVAKAADEHARSLAPVIEELKEEGHITFIAIAGELNIRKIPTARGGKWYPTTVKNLLARLAE